MPSRAVRVAFAPALAMPFWRSQSLAFSMSPLVASRARLESIMPAPVASRSALTWSAEIATSDRLWELGFVADLEASEARHGNVLAQLCNALVKDVAHRALVILCPGLVQKHAVLEELVQLPVHDVLNDLRRLLPAHRRFAELGPPCLDHIVGHVLATEEAPSSRGDMHRNLVRKFAKFGAARDKVALAIELEQHPKLMVVVNVDLDHAFPGDPSGLCAGPGDPLPAQPVNRFLEVAIRCLDGTLGVHHAGAGSLPERFHGLGSNCHGYFSSSRASSS